MLPKYVGKLGRVDCAQPRLLAEVRQEWVENRLVPVVPQIYIITALGELSSVPNGRASYPNVPEDLSGPVELARQISILVRLEIRCWIERQEFVHILAR